MLGYVLIGIGVAILYFENKGAKDAKGTTVNGNGGTRRRRTGKQPAATEDAGGSGSLDEIEPLIVTEVETDETIYQKEHGLDVDSPGNDLDSQPDGAPGDSQATGLTDEGKTDVGNELQNNGQDVRGNGGSDVSGEPSGGAKSNGAETA